MKSKQASWIGETQTMHDTGQRWVHLSSGFLDEANWHSIFVQVRRSDAIPKPSPGIGSHHLAFAGLCIRSTP
jgi:hypothetical protein